MEDPRPQKPRSVSDNTEKRNNQAEPQVRARSFTDLFPIFSKRQKVVKKDASTNTSDLQTRARPALPPERETTFEHVYEEIIFNNMNVESSLWNAEDVPPNKEMIQEESDEETSHYEPLNGSTKTTTQQKNSHKRNESDSAWSLNIGPVFSREEWEQILGKDQKLPPDLSSYVGVSEPDRETPKEAAYDSSTEEEVEEEEEEATAMKTMVKILDVEVETPKVSWEEPESPHPLPPKLPPSFSSSSLDLVFRSSIFYKLPLPGKWLPTDTAQVLTSRFGMKQGKAEEIQDAQLHEENKQHI